MQSYLTLRYMSVVVVNVNPNLTSVCCYVNVNPIVRQDLKVQFDIATVVDFMGSCKTDLLVF